MPKANNSRTLNHAIQAGWVFFLIIIICIISSPARAKYSGGAGEPNNPYQIATTNDLINLGKDTNDYDKHFILTADIDLAGYVFDKALIAPDTDASTESDFQGMPFTGIFDGKNHTISHLAVNRGGYRGLFGYLAIGAEVKNLGVVNVNIAGSGGYYVGGLVGYNDGGTLTGCYSTGVVSGIGFVGKLIGFNNYGIMTQCYGAGAVNGDWDVGGLVGYNWDATIKRCYSTNTVNGNSDVGGLTGINYGTIVECYNTGAVNGRNYVGGLVGYNDYYGTVTQCYNTGTISNEWLYIGGLVGYNNGDTVTQCYNTGAVIGGWFIAGLAGYNDSGIVTQCYNTGLVIGSLYVGGVVGINDGGIVTGSFWDVQASGLTTSDGGTGKTTDEMKDPNTFQAAGWDFVGQPDGPSDIWAQPVSDGYPILWWQLTPLPQLPVFSGGTGQPDSPYLISTAQELNSIGYNPRLMDSDFRLTSDIDLTGVHFYTIGNQFQGYAGVFDGNSYKISNFVYDSNEIDNVGLFGYVQGGTIKDLGLIDPNVNAGTGNQVGGLVGCLVQGFVIGCESGGGFVSGNWGVGGLVGENWWSTVTRCYSTNTVGGGNNVGGLVGYNGYNGTVTQCYSTGIVSGVSSFGGLVGINDGGNVTGSFWDMQTSGLSTSDGGTGRTTDEMKDPKTFQAVGWDFVGQPDGPSDIWAQPLSGGYPILWWQLTPLPQLPVFSGGTGQPDSPYLISTVQELNSIGYNPRLMDSHFRLISDIDLAGVHFYTIGSQYQGYAGVFDGNSYKISNFIYDSNAINNIGLFEYVQGGTIKDLGLIDPNINAGTGNQVGGLVGCLVQGSVIDCESSGGVVNGNSNIGGLVGENWWSNVTRSYSTNTVGGSNRIGGLVGYNGYYGTVVQCYSNGTVNGVSSVGGLVGYNDGCTVTQCYSTGIVDGNDRVGGLVGRNSNEYYGFGNVAHCYSTGIISGDWGVGGLVGENWWSNVIQCYSAGTVNGNTSVGIGGLVGINLWQWHNPVKQCFWDIQASGQIESAGGAGKTTAEMKTKSTFISADWDFIGETINGTEDFWKICDVTNYPRLVWQISEGDYVCPDGITMDDFYFFMNHWGYINCNQSNGYCNGTDLNFSGTVDIEDLVILVNNWLAEN